MPEVIQYQDPEDVESQEESKHGQSHEENERESASRSSGEHEGVDEELDEVDDDDEDEDPESLDFADLGNMVMYSDTRDFKGPWHVETAKVGYSHIGNSTFPIKEEFSLFLKIESKWSLQGVVAFMADVPKENDLLCVYCECWKEKSIIRHRVRPSKYDVTATDKQSLELVWDPIWSSSTTRNGIESLSCWKWSNQTEHKLYHDTSNVELTAILKARQTGGTPLLSANIWRYLWRSDSYFRSKIQIWRLVNSGFFINPRAYAMGLGDGLCKWCQLLTETLDHMFWRCRTLRRQKCALVDLIGQDRITRVIQSQKFPDFITLFLSDPTLKDPLLLVCAHWITTTWKERNNLQFANTKSRTPLSIIITSAYDEARARSHWMASRNPRRQQNLRETERTLEEWKVSLQTRSVGNGSTRHSDELISPRVDTPSSSCTRSSNSSFELPLADQQSVSFLA
ncbi:hypothetical protein R1sor_000913 [Riccia sorocarpa]|uniref:Reverse transcriptase zinc-binding domain-containing protein n=1 Tax=Riccia sorocarpa TaxID=122646 RepID=A0ABD3GWG3_9MARC